MSSKDILIAEFMGFQKTSMGWFDADEHLCLPNTSDNTFDELKFQSDWNWMMPVIQKILDISLNLDSMEMYYNITDSIPKIDQAYEEVVKFIINYNTTENEQY